MSNWSENWIYNLIPQEEYKLAFDMVNSKSISCALNQNEEIDYSRIEHVQDILELTLMDILKSEDVKEKEVAEVSQKIYLLLSALPMPLDSIDKAKHVLNILVYSYIGEQWESGRRYLIENDINILIEEKKESYRLSYGEKTYEKMKLTSDQECVISEILNSDSEAYFGSNIGNLGGVNTKEYSTHARPYTIEIALPPLAAVFFKHEG